MPGICLNPCATHLIFFLPGLPWASNFCLNTSFPCSSFVPFGRSLILKDLNTSFLVNAACSSSIDALHSLASGQLSVSFRFMGSALVEADVNARALKAKLVCSAWARLVAVLFMWARSWKSGLNSSLSGVIPVYFWKASSGSCQVLWGCGVGGGAAGWKERGVMWVGVCEGVVSGSLSSFV